MSEDAKRVQALFPEVAGAVLDDWAAERGYNFAPGIREAAVATMRKGMEQAASANPEAVAALVPMPRDEALRQIRALTEPALRRALDHGSTGFSEGECLK